MASDVETANFLSAQLSLRPAAEFSLRPPDGQACELPLMVSFPPLR
jgi:hypothetical protein